MTASLSALIVGPGEIAEVFARSAMDAGIAHVKHVLGRRPERARAFCERHGGSVVASLDEGLQDVDFAYVATPHTGHARATGAALAAGVPVLCEKPLTESPKLTSKLLATGQVPLMEAWMYRAHPQWHALVERIASGTLGELRHVQAEFAFDAPMDPAHRLFDPALAGGGILDVGGYPLSFFLGVLRAEAASTAPWSGIELVEASGLVGPTGVDVDTTLFARAGDCTAELTVALVRDGGMHARVEGTRGSAWLEEPFVPEGQRFGRSGVLVTEVDGIQTRQVIESPLNCFALEAAAFRAQLHDARRAPEFPLVDHTETLAIAELADRWRALLAPTR